MLSNQTSWRKANLTCKIAINNLEKVELLQGEDLLRQRKTTQESPSQMSSAITESLMGISRMMSQQVQQSEEAMQTLGNADPGVRSFSQRLQLQSPCPGTCHQALPPLPPLPTLISKLTNLCGFSLLRQCGVAQSGMCCSYFSSWFL